MKIYIFIFTILIIQGCSISPLYQPIVIGVNTENINDSHKLNKKNIAIRYTGESKTYNKFKIKIHGIERVSQADPSIAEESIDENTFTASSNLPVATSYALLKKCELVFNDVVIINDSSKISYDDRYILNIDIDDVDLMINLFWNGSDWFPAESSSETIISISYELKKSGHTISKGNVTGANLDKNSPEEHGEVLGNAFAQAASFLTLGLDVAGNGIAPDMNSKAYENRIKIVSDLNKYSRSNINASGDSQSLNIDNKHHILIEKYKGSLQSPPEGLGDHHDGAGLVWYSPGNYSIRRSIMEAAELAIDNLVTKIVSDISTK